MEGGRREGGGGGSRGRREQNVIILLPLFSALSLYNSGILPTAPLNKWMMGLIYEALHLGDNNNFVRVSMCVHRCVSLVKYIRNVLLFSI